MLTSTSGELIHFVSPSLLHNSIPLLSDQDTEKQGYDYLELREIAASCMLKKKAAFLPFMDDDFLEGLSYEVILTTRSNFVNLKWHRS